MSKKQTSSKSDLKTHLSRSQDLSRYCLVYKNTNEAVSTEIDGELMYITYRTFEEATMYGKKWEEHLGVPLAIEDLKCKKCGEIRLPDDYSIGKGCRIDSDMCLICNNFEYDQQVIA